MPKSRAVNSVHGLVLLALLVFLNACSVRSIVRDSAVSTPDDWRSSEPRHLFVFFDGTQNREGSGTNVHQLFDLVTEGGARRTRSFYIEGVGTDRHPLTGSVLGLGMERRIRGAYAFLASNFRPGDKIYIFGFSRGAHQARDLAGLLAYAGLPELPVGVGKRKLDRTINRVIRITRREEDSQHLDEWKSWTAARGPILAAELSSATKLEFRTAEVQLLGVWDTVPGSFFKQYDVGACMEGRNGGGTRYKTNSYPSVHMIAHAVSADEKRHKFRPLLVCEPIPNEASSDVRQKWFPGAHSDVGGGYRSINGEPSLANLSLNWMTNQLQTNYEFVQKPEGRPEDVFAKAHWSIGHWPGNGFSHCEDRQIPAGADRHPAIEAREGKLARSLLTDEDQKLYPKPCKSTSKD
jgi:uncharacterized protein (DUF2235 family)